MRNPSHPPDYGFSWEMGGGGTWARNRAIQGNWKMATAVTMSDILISDFGTLLQFREAVNLHAKYFAVPVLHIIGDIMC